MDDLTAAWRRLLRAACAVAVHEAYFDIDVAPDDPMRVELEAAREGVRALGGDPGTVPDD